ncbi:MAG: PQQ-dependent sugar dehydrogenase, partial [Myxococcota bacterium]
HTFAEDFFSLEPMPDFAESERLPELGMAGIALDEETGDVFVSFSYHDADGNIKFNVSRFDTNPGTFSLEPSGRTDFTDIFSDQPGDDSHMIGPLAVHEGLLYVNVGDAHFRRLVSQPGSVLGKMLRMTRDGDPVPSNPFYQDNDRKKPENYVFASGFRNPFGLKIVGGEIFVNDVGLGVDRFLRVEEGGDYQYDGTDWSFGAHSDMLFTPSVSPVQLDFHGLQEGPFPEPYRGLHYMATSGFQSHQGPTTHGEKSVLALEWDFDSGQVVGRPSPIMRYRGHRGLMPVGLAFGPDGLYVATLSRERDRTHPITKIVWRPEDPHPHLISGLDEMIENFGCLGCHRDLPGAPAVALDSEDFIPGLLARLNSSEYLQASLALDELTEEPYVSFRKQRKRIREAQGLERVQLWIKTRLLEPRFDDPRAVMPRLGLSAEEAQLIASHLVSLNPEQGFLYPVEVLFANFFPDPRLRHLLAFFVAGVFLTLLTGGLVVILFRWRAGSS